MRPEMIPAVPDTPAAVAPNSFKFRSLSHWALNRLMGCGCGCGRVATYLPAGLPPVAGTIAGAGSAGDRLRLRTNVTKIDICVEFGPEPQCAHRSHIMTAGIGSSQKANELTALRSATMRHPMLTRTRLGNVLPWMKSTMTKKTNFPTLSPGGAIRFATKETKSTNPNNNTDDYTKC